MNKKQVATMMTLSAMLLSSGAAVYADEQTTSSEESIVRGVQQADGTIAWTEPFQITDKDGNSVDGTINPNDPGLISEAEPSNQNTDTITSPVDPSTPVTPPTDGGDPVAPAPIDPVIPTDPAPSEPPVTDVPAPSDPTVPPTTTQTEPLTPPAEQPTLPQTTQQMPRTTVSQTKPQTVGKSTEPSQVAQPITEPIQTNTGAVITGTQGGQVVLSDGTLTSPEEVGGRLNADNTITVTKADGTLTTLPNTGEGTTGLLSVLGLSLLGVLTYVKKFKFND